MGAPSGSCIPCSLGLAGFDPNAAPLSRLPVQRGRVAFFPEGQSLSPHPLQKSVRQANIVKSRMRKNHARRTPMRIGMIGTRSFTPSRCRNLRFAPGS